MIIIASKPGQLGNSLFLYAHFISVALENKYSIINPSFNEYSDYFESTDGDIFCRFPKHKRSFFKDSLSKKILYKAVYYVGRIIHRLHIDNRFLKCIYLDWKDTFNLCNSSHFFNSRFVFIQGWDFRCGESFRKHIDEIRNFFKPLQIHFQNIDHITAVAKQNMDLLVGVHIRHGDYRKFEGGKYFYDIPQYSKLMKKMLNLLPRKKIIFLVCSNTKQEINLWDGMNVIKGTGHELEDLYAFSKCNYLIGPPSTFTMWASFYGEVPLYQVHDAESEFTLEDFKVVNN